MQKHFIVAALVSGVAFASGNAVARDVDPAALYAEGKRAFDKKDYTTACPKLGESYRADPKVRTLSLWARCLEADGSSASAWRRFLDLIELARQNGDKKTENLARWRSSQLEKKLSHVWVDVAKPVTGLEVRVGDLLLIEAEWGTAVAVDPGTSQLQAQAPGYVAYSTEVNIAPKEMTRVTVPELEPEPDPTPAPVAAPPPREGPAPPPAEEPEPDESSPPPVAALVAYGVGATGLALGAGFGFKARSKQADSRDFCAAGVCDDRGFRLRNDAIDAARISTIGFAVGAVGVAAGTVLLFFPKREGATGADSARVAPMVGRRAVGVAGTMDW